MPVTSWGLLGTFHNCQLPSQGSSGVVQVDWGQCVLKPPDILDGNCRRTRTSICLGSQGCKVLGPGALEGEVPGPAHLASSIFNTNVCTRPEGSSGTCPEGGVGGLGSSRGTRS
jgi:hypothetical protein